MKTSIYSLLAGAAIMAASLSLASCADSDSPAPWTPGPVSTAPGLFFTNTDDILSVTVGEDTHVSIPVRRLVTEGALTAPLIVTAGNDALIVPSEVTFADGQEDSSITIDLANIPTKELISLNITFPDEYINPYAAGPSVFDGSVLVSDWEAVTETPITFQWLDWSYQPTTILDPVDHVVMRLPGTNRFRIMNFLGIGIDFTFDLRPSEYPAWVGYNRIMPLGNIVLYSEYDWSGNYNPWWIVSDDLQEWPEVELTSGGEPVKLYAVSCMWYDDDNQSEYSYMRLAGDVDASGNKATKNFAYFSIYGFYGEDWDWANFTGYLHLYFEFPAQSAQ